MNSGIPFNELKDKTCVITGGAGIIGSFLAEYLSAFGIKVALVDISPERCNVIADNITRKTSVPVLAVEANVLDQNSLINGKMLINQKLGPVHFLINGAGGNSPKATTGIEMIDKSDLRELEDSFYGLDLEGFKEVFDLNFMGTVLPTMVFTTDMLKTGEGSVVNISSMNSFRPLTRIPAYSAAKAAVNNFNQWLAVHLARTGIRVNGIAPGFLVTRQNHYLLYKEDKETLSERGEKIISITPMNRFGEPADLAGTVLYLLSSLSAFITGVTIPVDGGFNAYSGV